MQATARSGWPLRPQPSHPARTAAPGTAGSLLVVAKDYDPAAGYDEAGHGERVIGDRDGGRQRAGGPGVRRRRGEESWIRCLPRCGNFLGWSDVSRQCHT